MSKMPCKLAPGMKHEVMVQIRIEGKDQNAVNTSDCKKVLTLLLSLLRF